MLGCFRFTTVKNTRAGKKSCDFDEESKKSALKCVALSVYVRTIRLVRRPISSAAPPSSPTAWPPLICLARSCWSASKPRSSGEPFLSLALNRMHLSSPIFLWLPFISLFTRGRCCPCKCNVRPYTQRSEARCSAWLSAQMAGFAR